MNNCCLITNLLRNLLTNDLCIINILKEIVCKPTVSLRTIEQMLANNNPQTIAAEYPSVEDNRFVVSAPFTRFLDLLNTDIFVIFKIDNINYDLSVYFKDSIGYEHPVVLSNGTPVKVNLLLLNGKYAAKYQYSGGYIILDSLIPLNPDIIPI